MDFLVDSFFWQAIQNIDSSEKIQVLCKKSELVCVNFSSGFSDINYSTQKRTNNGRIVRCITFQCVHDVIGTFTDELCQFPRVFSFFIVCQPSNPPQPGQRISGKRTTSSLLSEKEVIFYCTNSTLLVDSPTLLNIRPEGSQTKSSPKPLIRSL